MDGHVIKTKIEQGIGNSYRVFVDTVDGTQHRVIAALGSSNTSVSVKLKRGIATINANNVTAVRQLEYSDNKPKEEQ